MFGKVIRFMVRNIKNAFSRRVLFIPKELKYTNQISDALKIIKNRTQTEAVLYKTSKPVFIFSAGWRSGSTLLQRLVISSGKIVIWGEPLGRAALAPAFSRSLLGIERDWPPDHYMEVFNNISALTENWIANMTPPLENLRSAHRAFYDAWLAQPAKDLYGARRWGIKEVRLTIDHARYFKWLYPDAKFLFICRNPFDSYRSWRGNRWGRDWPNYFPWSPIVFTRHWKLLTKGFFGEHPDVGGMFIRFEDLISDEFDFKGLSEYLEVDNLDRATLNIKISSKSKDKSKIKDLPLTFLEKRIIRSVAGKVLNNIYPEA